MATKKFFIEVEPFYFVSEDLFCNAQFNDDGTIITDIKSMTVSDIMKHMHDDNVERILMNNKTYYSFEFILKTLLTKGLLSEDTVVNLHIDRNARAHEDLTLDTPIILLNLEHLRHCLFSLIRPLVPALL